MDNSSSTWCFDPVAFRHILHQHPELSGKEESTSRLIVDSLLALGFQSSQIKCGIGGYGVILTVTGYDSGPTSIFRSDFDALPISEKTGKCYTSQNPGVMHACGHDGHTASLLSLAAKLRKRSDFKGTVVLLFQPAEEIGEGAKSMLGDPALQIPVDYIFGFHNIPGYKRGVVLVRDGTFACASTGLEISLTGAPSHAAYPENGINPAPAMSEIVQFAGSVSSLFPGSMAMATVCYVTAGSETYGTAAGMGKVCLTLRSDNREVFYQMKELFTTEIEKLSSKYSLDSSLRWIEEFTATVNDVKSTELVRDACKKLNLESFELKDPMRWSEDFGVFTERWDGCYFGIGSGTEHPELHNNNYDFPDELINVACDIFYCLFLNIHYS